jgi:hypothetical protein
LGFFLLGLKCSLLLPQLSLLALLLLLLLKFGFHLRQPCFIFLHCGAATGMWR